MLRSSSSALMAPSTVDCSQRAIAMLSEYIRQRASVSSLFRYRTWPGPPGEDSTRQKVAFVVKLSLSIGVSRMTEFSPVSITRFASIVLITDVSGLVLGHRTMIANAAEGQFPAASR